MDSKRIVELQETRGAKTAGGDPNLKKIEAVIGDCRRFIQERSSSYRTLSAEEKINSIKSLIVQYVMENKPMAEGYVDEDNKADTNRLVDRLIESITDHDFLSAALADEDVYEIRVNGKEVLVEITGRVDALKDKDGNILSFESVEQQDIVLRKLLGDVRLTPKDAIANGRTVEGFRIAAVHSSVLSPDPSDANALPYHAFVLRKFKKSKMTLGQIVEFETLSDNMARFLALLPAGGCAFYTVGPTASGKTTLNNAILKQVPPKTRTILLQNPSEIDMRFKDLDGRVYNDVLHLEARDIENPTENDPTMENLMSHILRLSPTFVCFGELRKNSEFKLAVQIGQAGHPINGTYHAANSEGALRRYLTAYLAESGNEPAHLALSTIVDIINVIIVQKILADGTRKVMQITEICGVDPDNQNKPILNDLYIFEPEEESECDDDGVVIKIHGKHRRVGKLSDRTVGIMKERGVSTKRFDYLIKDLNEDEEEEYTGENIELYGLRKANSGGGTVG